MAVALRAWMKANGYTVPEIPEDASSDISDPLPERNAMKRITVGEPAVLAGLAQSVLALIVAVGFHLTARQAGSIEAAFAALVTLYVAFSVRPFPVAAVTGAMTTVGTLLIAFGVPHVSSGLVSTVNAVLASVLALVLRGHVTPVSKLRAAKATVV